MEGTVAIRALDGEREAVSQPVVGQSNTASQRLPRTTAGVSRQRIAIVASVVVGVGLVAPLAISVFQRGGNAVQEWGTAAVSRDAPVAGTGSQSNESPDEGSPSIAVAPFNANTARIYQVAWAAYLGRPLKFVNGIGQEIVLISTASRIFGRSQWVDSGGTVTGAFPKGQRLSHETRQTSPAVSVVTGA